MSPFTTSPNRNIIKKEFKETDVDREIRDSINALREKLNLSITKDKQNSNRILETNNSMILELSKRHKKVKRTDSLSKSKYKEYSSDKNSKSLLKDKSGKKLSISRNTSFKSLKSKFVEQPPKLTRDRSNVSISVNSIQATPKSKRKYDECNKIMQ